MKRLLFLQVKKHPIKAFSLAEMILTLGIFSIISLSLAGFFIASIRFSENRWLRVNALMQMQEVSNAMLANKNDLWKSIVTSTNQGAKHLEFSNNLYQIVDGAALQSGITLNFIVGNVNRDTNGNIVQSGGTLDVNSREITVSSLWTDTFGFTNSVSNSVYVTNWNTYSFVDDTTADFNQGIASNTYVDPANGGQVRLQTIIYPDWCKPTLALNEYDLPGSAVSKSVFATTGHAYLGTAGTTTTAALTKLNIQGVTPPTIQVEGSFGGYLVNDSFIVGNVAYLATTDDSKEVVIVDVSQAPYTELGYFDYADKTTDASSIYVVGSVGYVAIGREVVTFDLSANTGSRTKLGEITLVRNPNWGKTAVAKVSQIVVRSPYIFGSLYEDWYELAIANATNPANITLVSSSSVNNQQTSDVKVSADGNRTYFGTNASSSEREFFIMNTTNKNSPSIIGRYDTNGMSIKGIAIIPGDNRAVLVGTGAEEYQAVNIATESSPVKCGGMQMDVGIDDVDTVSDVDGNAFSYLVTRDTTKEFKILRGGPGGGNGYGEGYADSGDFISRVFDTGVAAPSYYVVSWNQTIPAGTEIKFQLRSGPTSNLSSALWTGPDGTSGTFFSTNSGIEVPSGLQSQRYFQYKSFFSTGDQNVTPVLHDLKITYQK